jgi:pSer/pThr/pTyr-binding forkhead associated (FHA) protein
MSKLVLFLPDGTTLDIPLTRERTTIGRRANNDVCLPNLAVSGEHAVVVTILADSFLEDLNSTNGTLVNGNAIAKHFLRDKDQIDIGRHRLVYCVDDEAKLDPAVAEGIARVNVRDFGARVEPARTFARERQAPGNDSAGTATSSAASDSVPPPIAPISTPKVAPSVAPQPKAAAAQTPASTAPSKAVAAPQPSPPADDLPTVKVLSGVSAGAMIALTKDETTLGRPGTQVVSIVKTGVAFWLKPLEGATSPTVNGKPVGRDGLELAHGDVIEVAGIGVEFVNHRSATTPQDVAA